MFDFTPEQIDFINADRAEAPVYKEAEGRYDPFDLAIMRFHITNKIYSPFISRYILTVHDACEHAKCQVVAFIKEDKAAIRRAQNKRYRQNKKNKLEVNSALLAAKENWQNAIRQRKAAIDGWDKFVAGMHSEYLKVKSLKVEDNDN
jgi:hypothetical protein